MAQQKKYYRMPSWIWKLPPQVLSGEDKRFLAFIWWCGFDTCHCHNWYLALKFGFTKRTIQLRIAKLKKLKFIAIGYPDSYKRTIFPRALKDHSAWLYALSGLRGLPLTFTSGKKVSLKGANSCAHSKTSKKLNPRRREP